MSIIEQNLFEIKNKTVIVGLSGGVDSAVAAYLLKKQGCRVIGVFMKNWEEFDTQTYCSAAVDIKDATDIAEKLDIKLEIVNFAREYWQLVFEYFIAEYKNGRTPNPDILCNKEIKFNIFLNYALNNYQADYIATGHYAKIKFSQNKYYLYQALDKTKDQSYFLHALNQEQLKRTIFPLSNITKKEVRQIAKDIGLNNHNKKDSTGICFIGEVKFSNFLKKFISNQPGNIIDLDHKILGKHDGLMNYTIGQRQGLNLGGLKNYTKQPWYVADKNSKDNTVLVVQGEEHPLLFKTTCEIEKIHFINPEYKDKIINQNKIINFKSRYRGVSNQATLQTINNSDQITVNFAKPERAITPGQFMVFYENELCLGGATII